MKLTIRKFVSTLVLLCSSWTAMAIPTTVRIERPVDKTSDFTGYLNEIWKIRLINMPSIVPFVEGLERGELLNPVSIDAQDHGNPYESLRIQYARAGVENYIQQVRKGEILIDQAEVLSWVKSQIQERKRTEVQRQEVGGETDILDKRMVFNWVEGRNFYMQIEYFCNTQSTPVSPQGFEMLSSRVKQWHWVMIMGGNPFEITESTLQKSLFPYLIELEATTKSDLSNLKLANERVRYQIDHDVMGVQVSQIQEFLKRLNRLSMIGSPLLKEMIEDHQTGDQFRLPSEAEWSLVVQDREYKPRFECGKQSEKFNSWVVDGHIFDGFNHEGFEWVEDGSAIGDQSWGDFQETWHAELRMEHHPVPFSNFHRVPKHDVLHVRRRAWSKEYPTLLMRHGPCRSGYSEGRPIGDDSFRLVRMRSHQPEPVSEREKDL